MSDWFFIVVGAAAFAAALLTFFSGFGLGTILAPVFMIFFPIEVAVALTSVVHLVNGIFKVILVGGHAMKTLLFWFGLPSVIAAPLGAWLLVSLPHVKPLTQYDLFGATFEITLLGATMGVVLMVFALWELMPERSNLPKQQAWLPIGGALSGFFGGFSGHQGALRSAFLIKTSITKEQFIGTSAVIAVAVDLSRIGVYSVRFSQSELEAQWPLIATASLCAMAGALLGKQWLKKTTLSVVRTTVGVLLLVIALAVGGGLL